MAEPGKIAGDLQFDWFMIKRGTPVLVAVGDTQCAVYSILRNPNEAGMCIYAYLINIDNEMFVAYIESGLMSFDQACFFC